MSSHVQFIAIIFGFIPSWYLLSDLAERKLTLAVTRERKTNNKDIVSLGYRVYNKTSYTMSYSLSITSFFLYTSIFRLRLLCEPAPPAGQLSPWREGYPAGVWVVHRQARQGPAAGRRHCGRAELQEETLWILLQVHFLHYPR